MRLSTFSLVFVKEVISSDGKDVLFWTQFLLCTPTDQSKCLNRVAEAQVSHPAAETKQFILETGLQVIAAKSPEISFLSLGS